MGKKNHKLKNPEVFDDIMEGLKQAKKIEDGTATSGRINVLNQNLHASYDIALDTLTVKNRNARITENEDLRQIESFKKLIVYEDRYSGDTTQLDIPRFKVDGWHANEDLVAFLLITSFDISEPNARSMCKRFYEPGVVS